MSQVLKGLTIHFYKHRMRLETGSIIRKDMVLEKVVEGSGLQLLQRHPASEYVT